jgi:hypothetical protein
VNRSFSLPDAGSEQSVARYFSPKRSLLLVGKARRATRRAAGPEEARHSERQSQPHSSGCSRRNSARCARCSLIIIPNWRALHNQCYCVCGRGLAGAARRGPDPVVVGDGAKAERAGGL